MGRCRRFKCIASELSMVLYLLHMQAKRLSYRRRASITLLLHRRRCRMDRALRGACGGGTASARVGISARACVSSSVVRLGPPFTKKPASGTLWRDIRMSHSSSQ
jgi:hypothetical protein